MNDLQDIRQTIETLLRDPAHARAGGVADAAHRYAAACSDLNRRLQRCEEYLARGLRSEAAQLAECPPNIRHVADALRLSDPAAWDALCEAHGQAKPPNMRLGVLDQLSAELEHERRLAPLLNRLRVLALARGAAGERIEVLRAMRQEDQQNAIWTDQLRMLEPVRLDELRLKADTTNSDAESVIGEVLREVEGAKWVTRPDPNWVAALHNRQEEARRIAALAELPVEAVTAAFAARDYDRCATLLAQWQAVVESHAPLALPEQLRAQIREVSAWVATETRRRTMNDRLRAAAAIIPPARSSAPPAKSHPPAKSQPPANAVSRMTDAMRRLIRPRPSGGSETDEPSSDH